MKTLKVVLSVLSLAWATQVHAQQTNLVQNLSVDLFGFAQGGSSSFGNTVTTNINVVHVGTREIIQALAAATANSFSSTSKLVLVTPLGGGSLAVQVRDGANTPVDVSDFFVVQVLTGSVNASVLNTKNGHGTSVSYDVEAFTLQDADGATLNVHFGLMGIATSNSSTPHFGPQSPGTSANVSGGGDRNGKLLILQGSINTFGNTLEVTDGVFTGSS